MSTPPGKEFGLNFEIRSILSTVPWPWFWGNINLECGLVLSTSSDFFLCLGCSSRHFFFKPWKPILKLSTVNFPSSFSFLVFLHPSDCDSGHSSLPDLCISVLLSISLLSSHTVCHLLSQLGSLISSLGFSLKAAKLKTVKSPSPSPFGTAHFLWSLGHHRARLGSRSKGDAGRGSRPALRNDAPREGREPKVRFLLQMQGRHWKSMTLILIRKLGRCFQTERFCGGKRAPMLC